MKGSEFRRGRKSAPKGKGQQLKILRFFPFLFLACYTQYYHFRPLGFPIFSGTRRKRSSNLESLFLHGSDSEKDNNGSHQILDSGPCLSDEQALQTGFGGNDL